jgi:hypothetical protein
MEQSCALASFWNVVLSLFTVDYDFFHGTARTKLSGLKFAANTNDLPPRAAKGPEVLCPYLVTAAAWARDSLN